MSVWTAVIINCNRVPSAPKTIACSKSPISGGSSDQQLDHDILCLVITPSFRSSLLFTNFTQFFIHLFLFQMLLTILCISGSYNCNEAKNKRKPFMGNIFYNFSGAERGNLMGSLEKLRAPRASAVTVNRAAWILF